MNLLVLGATGKTGSEILDLALDHGHRVTAFVRSPHKIRRQHERLTLASGDARDTERLSAALLGHDAVLSALGQPPRQALRPSTFMAECAASTVAAMKRSGVSRLAILSAAVLFPGTGLRFAFFHWLLANHARDLVAMETVVKATDFDWTITRPPRLVHARSETYRTQVGALPEDGFTVSFRAVAAFMLSAVEHRSFLSQVVGLAG
jgi:putative NADH-flavin reductase